MPDSRAAALHRAGAGVRRGERDRRPGRAPRPSRLPARPARGAAAARGGRPADDRGRDGLGSAGVRAHRRRAGRPAAHEAEGVQRRAQLRARRVPRHLRRRGPPGARPAAQGCRRVPGRAAGDDLPAGPAVVLERGRERPDAVLHARVRALVRPDAGRPRRAAPADPARRHVEPLPRRAAARGRRLGSAQRDRGRRPRPARRRPGHDGLDARLDHARGGVLPAVAVDQAAHALDQGLHADGARPHAASDPVRPHGRAARHADARVPGRRHAARVPGRAGPVDRLPGAARVRPQPAARVHGARRRDARRLQSGDRQRHHDRRVRAGRAAAPPLRPRAVGAAAAGLLGAALDRGLARARPAGHEPVQVGEDAARPDEARDARRRLARAAAAGAPHGCRRRPAGGRSEASLAALQALTSARVGGRRARADGARRRRRIGPRSRSTFRPSPHRCRRAPSPPRGCAAR